MIHRYQFWVTELTEEEVYEVCFFAFNQFEAEADCDRWIWKCLDREKKWEQRLIGGPQDAIPHEKDSLFHRATHLGVRLHD